MYWIAFKPGFFRTRFMYIDTKENEVDKLFSRHGIKTAHFGASYWSSDEKQLAITFASVRNREFDEMVDAMQEIENHLILLGYGAEFKSEQKTFDDMIKTASPETYAVMKAFQDTL